MGRKRKDRDQQSSKEEKEEEEDDLEPTPKKAKSDHGDPATEILGPMIPAIESTAAKPEAVNSEAVEGHSSLMDEEIAQRENMQLLVSAFTNTQQDQYEIFRRATFPKSSIRRIMQGLCSSNVPQNAVIAMAGITKVYVGEIVEAACQARDAQREEGPLQPKHIREAVRRLRQKNKIFSSRYRKVFPFR